MSCLGLHLVPSSLACYVYFMFCSIFLNVFVFRLNFIFSFILHLLCIIFYPCSYLLFFPSFLLFHMSLCDKDGESIPKSISVCFVISIWLMCTFLGEKFYPCTFVGGESHKGDVYTRGEKTFLFKKTLLCLFYSLFVFLFCFMVLWVMFSIYALLLSSYCVCVLDMHTSLCYCALLVACSALSYV